MKSSFWKAVSLGVLLIPQLILCGFAHAQVTDPVDAAIIDAHKSVKDLLGDGRKLNVKVTYRVVGEPQDETWILTTSRAPARSLFNVEGQRIRVNQRVQVAILDRNGQLDRDRTAQLEYTAADVTVPPPPGQTGYAIILKKRGSAPEPMGDLESAIGCPGWLLDDDFEGVDLDPESFCSADGGTCLEECRTPIEDPVEISGTAR